MVDLQQHVIAELIDPPRTAHSHSTPTRAHTSTVRVRPHLPPPTRSLALALARPSRGRTMLTITLLPHPFDNSISLRNIKHDCNGYRLVRTAVVVGGGLQTHAYMYTHTCAAPAGPQLIRQRGVVIGSREGGGGQEFLVSNGMVSNIGPPRAVPTCY